MKISSPKGRAALKSETSICDVNSTGAQCITFWSTADISDKLLVSLASVESDLIVEEKAVSGPGRSSSVPLSGGVFTTEAARSVGSANRASSSPSALAPLNLLNLDSSTMRPCSSSVSRGRWCSLSDPRLAGRTIGIALDCFAGFTMLGNGRPRSMFPKMELDILPLSLPDSIGDVTEPETEKECIGVKDGAPGLKVGAPAAEKLNSLDPGEKTGALTLILDAGAGRGLNWPDWMDSGPMGTKADWNAAG